MTSFKLQTSNLNFRPSNVKLNKIMAEKVRIDKWLWSVRIFKSRTLAADTIKSGKVKVNDVQVKSSFLIVRGNTIVVKKGGFNFTFKVIDLIEKRVGAAIAVQCYKDLTPEEELNKYRDWFVGKTASEMRDRGTGRPTKRERRDIDDFKDYYFDEEGGEEEDVSDN
jgi:ribosome-associated heat shock protein Hsp15